MTFLPQSNLLRERNGINIHALETEFANDKVKNISPTSLMAEMTGSY